MKLKTQIMRNISLNKFFIHSTAASPQKATLMNQHAVRTKEAALPKTGQMFYCFRALSLPFGLFRVAEATVE